MATTCMLALASTILRNEEDWRQKDVETQFERYQDALETARANPHNYEAQVMKILQEDKLNHLSELKDVEMQKVLAETRAELFKL